MQNTEKGTSVKVEKSQTYVKMQNKKVQSGTETNQDKERSDKKLDFFFF
jgi:hypothetical protein